MSDLLVDVDRRSVAAGGVRFLLHRTDPAQPTDAPPVLLLHGVPQTAGMWRDVVAELRRDRVVLAPDLPGLGGSELTGRYDVPSVVRALAALVVREVDGPVDVIGHDWGGALAFSLAGRRPDLVRRLGVIDAPYRRLDLLHAWYMGVFALPVLPEAAFRLVGRTLVRTMLEVGSGPGHRPDPAAEREYVDAYADPARVAAMLGYYRATVRPHLLSALRGRRIVLPPSSVRAERTLVIWGAHDPALPLRVGEMTVRDLEVDAEFVTVPSAGHFVVEEAPQVVVPLLAELVRG